MRQFILALLGCAFPREPGFRLGADRAPGYGGGRRTLSERARPGQGPAPARHRDPGPGGDLARRHALRCGRILAEDREPVPLCHRARGEHPRSATGAPPEGRCGDGSGPLRPGASRSGRERRRQAPRASLLDPYRRRPPPAAPRRPAGRPGRQRRQGHLVRRPDQPSQRLGFGDDRFARSLSHSELAGWLVGGDHSRSRSWPGRTPTRRPGSPRAWRFARPSIRPGSEAVLRLCLSARPRRSTGG